MSRLVIIPARGGSKRIANKNIKEFCSRPIIFYPIDVLVSSNLFDEIHVSTDSHEIYELVSWHHLPPAFMRPNELSDDLSGLMEVMQFVVNAYLQKFNKIFNQIWLVMPCNPFLDLRYIKEANDLAVKHPTDCIISVTEYPAPIEWAFNLIDGELKACNPEQLLTRSQDLNKKYFDNGMFAIFPGNYFYKRREIGPLNYRGLVMPKDSCVDIDDLEDWKLAESIYQSKKMSTNNC